MLKGLEVSEVRLSELERETRIDAELYDKGYIRFKSVVKRVSCATFAEECTVIKKGIFNINASCYCKEGIPFVRISNIKDMIIDTTEIVHIPQEEHLKNLKTGLQKDDIILSKTAIPAASIVTLDCCNVSQDTVAIKLKTNSKLLSHYVVVFLNTRYGLEQMRRRFTGNIQMHLNLEECKNEVLIPVFPICFQENIKDKFVLAIKMLEESKQLYAEAENLLLEELGLKNWQPKNENINVKPLSESFLSSGRLDAEFYQSKYDEIEDYLKQNNQTDLLGNICFVNQKNTKPKDKEQYKYIELSNINTTGEITGCTIDYGEKLPSRARQVVKTGDVIVSSVEGSLDSCALVTPEYDNAFCSTGFYIIRSKAITSETLLVLMKLKPIQQLLKKGCSGTILTAINYDNFCNIVIPVSDGKIQTEISAKIQRSFTLKKESKSLLEQAKTMVENEIEKGV